MINFVRKCKKVGSSCLVFFCWEEEEEEEAQSVVMYDSKELLEVASSSVVFFLFSFFCSLDLQEESFSAVFCVCVCVLYVLLEVFLIFLPNCCMPCCSCVFGDAGATSKLIIITKVWACGYVQRDRDRDRQKETQTDTQEELGDSSGVCALLDEGAWECYQRILSSKLESDTSFMMAAAAKEVPDSSSSHSRDDSSSGGDGSSSLSNHTVILGWNTKLASLVRQLAMANHSLGGGVIAVLADKDTQQMEEEMKAHELDLMGTSVIYHTGCPLDKTSLQKVAVSEARATIILAETTDAEESDTRAVKIVREICWTVEHDEMKGHIVVEVVDPENEAWVKQAGQDLVYTVAAHNLVAHLLVQCARQPGLAQVWEDILGFDNAEFYVKKWPELDGLPFGDVLFCFPDAIPCGVKVAAMENTIVLNPDDDYILSEGDELIVLAEDDNSYFPLKSLPKIADVKLQKSKTTSNDAKKILFCGWQHDSDDIISILENSCVPGSEVWIFSKTSEAEREIRLADKGIKPTEFENVKLVHCIGDPSNRTDLESLPLESFDSILLAPDGDNTVLHTDPHPVSTLLRIRSIQSKRMSFEDVKAVQIRQGASAQSTWVQEMQQGSNQSIIISGFVNAETTKEQIAQADVSGVMVSDDMVAMVLAMVAEDKKVSYILSELFAQEGHEFFFRSAEIYLRGETEELSFYDIMSRARHQKEIVLGYQHAFGDHPIMNPPDKAAIKTWSAHDGFIVLAEI